MLLNEISEIQFGFVKNVGTKDALDLLSYKLYDSLDKNQKTVTTLLDLAKAFYKASHYILLKKLEDYGIRGKTMELRKSYLTGQ